MHERYCISQHKGEKMKILVIVGKVFRLILYILIISIAAAIAAMLLFGLKLFCVQTGSMEPRYPVGDMIVVKAVDFDDLVVDDVITFRLGNDTIVTHRIIGIDADANQLTTKGDNNNVADASTVKSDQVIGKVVFDVPGAGYAILFLNTRFGKWMVVIAGLALIGIAIIRKIYYRSEDDDEPDDPKSDNPQESGNSDDPASTGESGEPVLPFADDRDDRPGEENPDPTQNEGLKE